MSELTDPVLVKPQTGQPLEVPPNALEMILDWSKDLPDWQSDAVRRILQQRELSDQDVQEILAMLKATEGLISEPLQTQPKRLAKEDLPAQAGPGTKVVLEFLGDLQNVNALAPQQTIKFQPNGLTVVFGRNATGKSGYARVLKKACRARGDRKPILPDVFSNSPSSGPALATIGIHDGSRSIKVPWVDGNPSREELGSIAVFDAHCARVYVDEANDVFYVPYGLDVFDKLSRLCEKLKGILQAEIAGINVDRKFLEDLKGTTSVGKVIEGLTHETDAKTIEGLGTFSETDEQRLSDLGRRLTEIKVNDPKTKARQLRATKERILRLVDSLKKLEDGLSATTAEAIQTVQAEVEEAQKVARIASQRSFEKEPVAGVASEPWETLLLAAKEYSEQHAYKGEAFPVTKDGARCVLCFQALTPEAADRLRKFWDFIEGTAQKTYQRKNQELQTRISNLQNLQVDPLATDPGFSRELEDVDVSVAQKVKDCIESAQGARKVLLECIANKSWGSSPPPSTVPLEALRRLAQDQENRAAEFDRMSVVTEKEKLEAEFSELDARKRLTSKKDAMISLLQNLKHVKKIEACISETVTTGFSRKSTEFMELLVTDRLKEELKRELKDLEVDYMKLELNKTGRLGVTLHKHRLRSKTHGTVSVSDVMSEGEQKAIAIASFLAELNISQGNCGVIFDDPVSSLDHQRREKAAVRLAKEAKKRQVVVFTHDMIFLSALQEAALKNGVDHLVQTVWARPDAGIGNCDPNPPWAGQTVNDRLGYLKGTLLIELASLSKDSGKRKEYERAATEFLTKLRQTWERAVEEVVLGGVVMRFRNSIEPMKLGSVQFTDAEDKVISEAMDRLSAYLHDEASAHDGSPMPNLDWFQNEIQELESFIKSLRHRDREKAIKDKRPWRKRLDR